MDDFSSRCRRDNEAGLQNRYFLELFPRGRIRGRELKAGDIYGGPGSSFSLNLATGQWSDFAAGGLKGGDLVSLVAAREGGSQREALEKLEHIFGVRRAPLPLKPDKSLPVSPIEGPPDQSWIYTDAQGRELYRAQRWQKPGRAKACRLKINGGEKQRVPLYLPELLAAIKNGRQIFIVEGEPKADLLRSWNLAATTFAGGVNGYRPELASWFAGAAVVIIVDADEPGRAFGRRLGADLSGQPNKGVKLIELPEAKFEGYDLIDWARNGGSLGQLTALVARAPFYRAARNPKRPLQADPAVYTGLKDLELAPVEYDWLIDDSLRRGQLGMICGPPGCGKGLLALQLSVALAAGRPLFDFWNISGPARVLFISAEDDEATLHNRLHYALHHLPPEERRPAAARLARLPVKGLVNICRGEKNGVLTATDNFEDLGRLAAKFKPDLLVLDTLARFFGVDENDNPAVTAACGLLEEIIEEAGCNILLIHHASKSGGDLAGDKKKLNAALTQTAIRGASALAGCVRWALLMAPLSAELAADLIGPEASGQPGGSYVAARVAKKNAGRAEEVCYLERGDHGLFQRVELKEGRDRFESIRQDARRLTVEVERRARAGESPLAATNGGRQVFNWNYTRSRRAMETAVEEGLLIRRKRPGLKGYILAPASGLTEESQ